jgi:glycosyltransferase involved in cell wall biosynthesis
MTNGYLATPYIPKELARGINWILNADQYSKVSKNATEIVQKNFNITYIAKKYIEFYKHLE